MRRKRYAYYLPGGRQYFARARRFCIPLERFEQLSQLMAKKRGATASEILKQLRLYYDGYRFSKHDLRVHNPFSILTALKQKDFK